MNTKTAVSADFPKLLERTLRCSRYAKRVLDAEPALLDWLTNNYTTPCTPAEILALISSCGLELNDETQLARAVRVLRKQVMVKLILRDLNGLADLNEVMRAMTALAEVCVQHAQACLTGLLCAQFGKPIGETSAATQELLVIGMGKLGGGELNVSSDIDLIFIYPEDGETDGERRLGNHEFFTRLGRRLINLINEPTGDGYVFRVDMRLRPYGDSGPLVMSFAALEEYLISQGREWERYAWIKARVISPASAQGTRELMQLTQPFVFRKYLDFGAIDSMRKLHAQIRQEVQRKDRYNNIKLGPGGIREIEFTAQVFQLIRGGRDTKLRIRPTQAVLELLAKDDQLSAQAVAELQSAYIFLRDLEHRLQYLDDQQTQDIPDTAEDRELIAQAMGFDDYPSLLEQLDRHRASVSQQFEHIFGAHQAGENDMQLWREDITDQELAAQLETLGYQTAHDTALRLQQLRAGTRYRQLPELSRQRVDRLVPQFIVLSSQQGAPDITLSRMLSLLEGVSRRAAYLAFLAEYPKALQRLINLVGASSWASDYMTQHPALFDELLDAREIYQSPDWTALDAEIVARLHDCAGDTERQMDVLRHAQQEQIFHLLAMDLQGFLPLEKLSDHLSELADKMLQHVLTMCWSNMRKRHQDHADFAIVSYGKLGGKELGYESDLDMIFIYDDDHPDAQENYSRLAQRINTLLSSYTAAGRLYETDLRLRPNGDSGLLVTTIASFAEYQRAQAWVWEHQALTRARFSAGDPRVGAEFEVIRSQILCQPRDLAVLRREIVAMRQKMHDGHPNNSDLFDIKHDSGGMVDIEFMVQYLVLAYAHLHPGLTRNAGNLALLNMASELGLIDAELALQTSQLYRALRQTQHRMRLNNQTPCRVPKHEISTEASLNLWRVLFPEH